MCQVERRRSILDCWQPWAHLVASFAGVVVVKEAQALAYPGQRYI